MKIWSLFKHCNLTTGNKILWKRGEIAPKEQFLLFSTIFSMYLTSGVKLYIHLWNVVVRFIFSSILQIWYVEVRISRSISEGPLDFEITGVDCIMVEYGDPHYVHRHVQVTRPICWPSLFAYALINPFIPDFLKRTLPSLNLDESKLSQKGCRVDQKKKKNAKLYSDKIEKANSVDPDERSHLDLDLHCLQSFFSGPEVIKRFSCSTQLSMKFVLLINFKLLTIANYFLLNMVEHENC